MDATPVLRSDDGLTARPDGSPVRLRRNGRLKKAVGLYFSVKSGRHLPYESTVELHDLWRAEVDVRVVSSHPQPFTLSFVQDGRLRRYTPDRKDVLADGDVEVSEVKAQAEEAERLRYVDVTELLAQRGLRFRLVDRSEIEREPAFSAVTAVQRHRRTSVSVEHTFSVGRVLEAGPQPLSELLALWPGHPAALATLCALMVRRVIAIDLAAGLTAASQVRLVS